MINNSRRGSQGFTLVELTLVMASMSVMLLAILYGTLQAGKLFDKGATNRTVNQISRDVSDGLRRDFLAADPTMVKFVETGTAPNLSGRLCLGTVSYLWNTASLLAASSSNGIKDTSRKLIAFVRVPDVGAAYCTKVNGSYPVDIAAGVPVSNVLSSTGKSFALYEFKSVELSRVDPQALYQVKMTLGTGESDTTVKTGGITQCKPPTDASSNFNYCSVVDLDMIVRAGGKT